jgi:large subunit ribosomal protein L23
MNSYSPLISPITTEKTLQMQEKGKYTFSVLPQATKTDIKQSVQSLYSVSVEGVTIVPVRKKVRLFGRGKSMVKRPASKKALVTLKKGQTLDVLSFSDQKAKRVLKKEKKVS